MEYTTLTCTCGNTKKLDYHINNMGDVQKEGWGVITTFDGKLLKSCPDCFKQVKELASRIVEITGNKYVSLSGVLK